MVLPLFPPQPTSIRPNLGSFIMVLINNLVEEGVTCAKSIVSLPEKARDLSSLDLSSPCYDPPVIISKGI